MLRNVAGLLSLTLIGCGMGSGYVIERTVGGEQRLGTFVAPHSYEHFVLGELARERGAYAEAIEHYELARAGAEDDPLLIARLADVRDRIGDRAGADRAIEDGMRLNDRAEAIWMARAEIAERRGQSDRAIESYARAAELGEGDEAPLLALARVLRDRGSLDRADAVLEEWIARAADGASAARARLALALSRGDARAAGLAALELARRSPAHAREVLASARATLEAGHPTLAHRIVALVPEGAVPRAFRLEVALAAGERSEAEGLLASWAPEAPSDLLEAARAWIDLGDPEQAAELAIVARARGAGTQAQVVLAYARLAQGRTGEAAAIAAAIPLDAEGGERARALIAEVLAREGLPALAAEVSAPRFPAAGRSR